MLIRQVRCFVETFVEAKHKQMFLIGNLENNVVLHRPPFPYFKPQKNLRKLNHFTVVTERNTVLYRVALKSKHTASYRWLNTLFVEILLRKLTSNLGIFISGRDRLRTNIIARSNTDHNLETQKALLKVSKARGHHESIRKDHYRVCQKNRASEAQEIQV